MSRPDRRYRGTWIAVAALAAMYVTAGVWIVPDLIRSAYDGTSTAFLNGIIGGRDVHGVEFYLAEWRRMFIGLSAAAVGLVAIAVGARTRFREQVSRLGEAPAWPFARVIAWAAVIGAISGVLQSIQRALRYIIERHPSRPFQWESVWMAPLAGASAFALAALVLIAFLVIVASFRKRRVSSAATVFVLSSLAFAGILADPTLRLASVAVALLALGLGSGVARHAARHPSFWDRASRPAAVALVALLTVTTVLGSFMLPAPLERRRVARLPPVSAGRPDVVLLILDTVRASSLSLYGYPRSTTPNIDRRATEGVVFGSAFSTAPWTLPSHASFFTGRWPHRLSADIGEPLDDRHATVAEVLSAAGYRTAGFTANLFNTSETSGLARGFARYEDYPVGWGGFVASEWLSRWMWTSATRGRLSGGPTMKDAARITDDFLGWLETAGGDRPFFAFVNYLDAHAPYGSPPRFGRRFPSDEDVVLPRDGIGLSEGELEGTRAAYDAAIAYVDEQVERLLAGLESLRRRGAIVIISSDHGEFFGEHGLVGHGSALYEPVVRVPLVIIHPTAVPGSTRVDEAVSLRDIPATIVDLALQRAEPRLAGRSLRRYWEPGQGTERPAEPVLAETTVGNFDWPAQTNHETSVILGSMHYIRHADGLEELFDLEADPRELRDIAGVAGYEEVLGRLATIADSMASVPPAPDAPP